MKRYNITVNGRAYDVAVDEVAGGAPVVAAPVAAPVVVAAPAPVAVAPAPVTAPAPVAVAPAPVTAPVSVEGGTKIEAPMPGTILEIKLSIGDSVEHGTPIVVLEAMKMENDIVATCSGKIASINVQKGDTVDSGTLIAIIQ